MVGIAQLVRAPDCGSGGREFESHYPPHIKYDSLAQSVEHLTFNQGVRSSNLRWITKEEALKLLCINGFKAFFISISMHSK